MTIQLKPEQERIIQEEIQSGHFRDVNELLTKALDALQEKGGSVIRRLPHPGENLVDVCAAARGLADDLELSRNPSTGRLVDL